MADEIYRIENDECVIDQRKTPLFSWDLVEESVKSQLVSLHICTPFDDFDDENFDDIISIAKSTPDNIERIYLLDDGKPYKSNNLSLFTSNRCRLKLTRCLRKILYQRNIDIFCSLFALSRRLSDWDADIELKQEFDNYQYKSLEILDNEIIIQDTKAFEIKPKLPSDLYDNNGDVFIDSNIDTITLYLNDHYRNDDYKDAIIPLIKTIMSFLPQQIKKVKVKIYRTYNTYKAVVGNNKYIPKLIEKIKKCFKSTSTTNIEDVVEIIERQEPYHGYILGENQENDLEEYRSSCDSDDPSGRAYKRIVSNYERNFIKECYIVNDDNIEDQIVLRTHIAWRSWKLPKVGQIPDGVKKITFEFINEPIGKGIIPESVISLVFINLNICLSTISFPSNLRHIDLGPKFNQFVFCNQDIPETVEYMEFSIDKHNASNHWLSYNGTLPYAVNYLKIKWEGLNGDDDDNSISSIRNIDGDSKLFKFKLPFWVEAVQLQTEHVSEALDSFEIINPGVYYDQYASRELIPFHPALKSITISYYFTENFSLNTFPSTLEYLDIRKNFGYSGDQIPSISFKYLPASLTSLKCREILGEFPEHLKLNYLEYSIEDCNIKQIIFSVSDRSITKYNTPTSFDKKTGLFNPQPTNIIDHLCWDGSILYPTKNAQVKLLTNSYGYSEKVQLESTQDLAYNILPSNYPESLERVTLRRPIKKNQLYSIPPTVKVLQLTENNINNLLLPNNNAIEPTIEPISNNLSPMNVDNHDLFFIIIRNRYLKKLVFDSISPRIIDFIHNNTTEPAKRKKAKFSFESSSSSLSSSTLNINSKSVNMLKNLKDKIPKTLKRVSISDKLFMESKIEATLPFLYQNNLLDHVYQVYKKEIPISSTTTVLIWEENVPITLGIIPFGIKKIIFGNKFNQTIIKDSLPCSINEISFGSGFSQCLSNICIPESVRYVSFNKYYQNLNPSEFPTFITHLYFLSYTNTKDLVKFFSKIPISITHLYFKFNTSVDTIDIDNGGGGGGGSGSGGKQKHITKIKYPTTQYLLYFLSAGQDKEENDDDDDDDGDDSMSIDISNDHQVVVPSFEIHLNYESDSSIPVGSLDHLNVKSIKFNSFNQALPKGCLPNSITELEFQRFNQFVFVPPHSLKSLSLNEFNQELNSSMLPPSLERLSLNTDKEIQIGVIPHGLKYLYLGSNYKHEIKQGVIPNTVEELIITINDNNLNTTSIPNSVTKLCLFECLTNISDIIPNSVEDLEIKNREYYVGPNESFDCNWIPRSVTQLSIKTYCLVNLHELPVNTKRLTFESEYYFGQIPSTIEYLQVLNYSSHIRIYNEEKEEDDEDDEDKDKNDHDDERKE